jgi:hypothetical protein
LALVATSAALGQGNGNSNVIPPQASFRGYSYSELQTLWWQTALSVPVVDGAHPLFNGAPFGGDDGIVFLAGLFGEGNVVDITIPSGTALFFPILNVEVSEFEPPPFNAIGEEALRARANELLDEVTDLFATIDGRAVNGLDAYRTESGLFTWGPLPEGNIFQAFGLDAPAGTTSDAYDAGYYLLVKPLSVGEHVIHFGATFGGELSGEIDTTYRVRVVPRGRY